MERKIEKYKQRKISFSEIYGSYKGWRSYSCWADTKNLQNDLKRKIVDELYEQV
mgnify:CR=1 FL=1